MKAKLKSELAREYGISIKTFQVWLREVPDINVKPKQRILSPKQTKMFYEFHGYPDNV